MDRLYEARIEEEEKEEEEEIYLPQKQQQSMNKRWVHSFLLQEILFGGFLTGFVGMSSA